MHIYAGEFGNLRCVGESLVAKGRNDLTLSQQNIKIEGCCTLNMLADGGAGGKTLTYVLLGASYLWPWNCILTVIPMLTQKLNGHEWLAKSLSSFLMTGSTLTVLAVSLYTALRAERFASRIRYGELTIAIAFVIIASLLLIPIQGVPYFLLLVALFCLSSAGSALVQNGSFAIAQHIPGGHQLRAILIGQAIAGVAPSLTLVLVSLFKGSHQMYTRTTESNIPGFVLLSCSVIALLSFVSYRGSAIQQHADEAELETTGPPSFVTLTRVARELSYPIAIIIILFSVSLAYPVFANTVKPPPGNHYSQWEFATLTHLAWNLFDLIGRVLGSVEYLRIKNLRALLLLSILRVCLVVILLKLAWQPQLTRNIYVPVMEVFGFTNGFLISSTLSLAPSLTADNVKAAAGGVISFTISVGLSIGSIASFLVSRLV